MNLPAGLLVEMPLRTKITMLSPDARTGRWPRAVVGICGGLLLLAVFSGTLVLRSMAPPATPARGLTTDGLFTLTNVWKVHLTFTPDQWEAMEPQGGAGPLGGRGGPGGPGGRGGPGGQRGPRGFGPATFIAQVFLDQGDSNRDSQLSQAEFAALGRKWFTAWDTNMMGKLDTEKIRAGLNAAFAPPNLGPPGPGGPGLGLQGAEGRRNGLASAMGIEFRYVHGLCAGLCDRPRQA